MEVPPGGPPKTAPTVPAATPAAATQVPGVDLPVAVAPTPTVASAAQLYVTGSYTQSTTLPADGRGTTTTAVDVAGGYRYVSRADENRNGKADEQASVYGFYRQNSTTAGSTSTAGVGGEYRREFGSGDAYWAVKGEIGQTTGPGGGRTDARVGIGVTIPFGGGGTSRREPSAVEVAQNKVDGAQKAFDASLRGVYRSPEAVGEKVASLDRTFDPAGLSFGQIAGALQQREFLAGGAAGLTQAGSANGPAVQKTVDAYVGLRQAEINVVRSASPERFDAAVRQQEALIGGFQSTFGQGWQRAYGEFRTTGALPAGTPEVLSNAAAAQLSYEQGLPPAVASASRDQAEINQYARERTQTQAPTPAVQPATPAALPTVPQAGSPTQPGAEALRGTTERTGMGPVR